MPLTHQVFNLVSSDGTSLKGHFWKPKKHPIATLCLVHGIGDHSGRYDIWARRFCKQGIMVFAIDYRGHGLSAGQRGHINSIDELHDDIAALIRRCKRNHADIPTFIYGHSMGGNLVLSYLLKRRQDFAGAIITSPWLGLVNPPSAFGQKAGTIINRLLPSFTFRTGIKSNSLSCIEENQVIADKDVLMHGRISIRTFFELDKSAREIITNSKEIHIPIIICHGNADHVTRHDLSENLAASNPGLFKFISYPGALHELHNEPLAESLFDDLLNWLVVQLEKSNQVKIAKNQSEL